MEEFRKHKFLLKFIQTQYGETFVNDVEIFLQNDKQPDRVFQPKPMTYADAASIGAHTGLNKSGDTESRGSKTSVWSNDSVFENLDGSRSQSPTGSVKSNGSGNRTNSPKDAKSNSGEHGFCNSKSRESVNQSPDKPDIHIHKTGSGGAYTDMVDEDVTLAKVTAQNNEKEQNAIDGWTVVDKSNASKSSKSNRAVYDIEDSLAHNRFEILSDKESDIDSSNTDTSDTQAEIESDKCEETKKEVVERRIKRRKKENREEKCKKCGIRKCEDNSCAKESVKNVKFGNLPKTKISSSSSSDDGGVERSLAALERSGSSADSELEISIENDKELHWVGSVPEEIRNGWATSNVPNGIKVQPYKVINKTEGDKFRVAMIMGEGKNSMAVGGTIDCGSYCNLISKQLLTKLGVKPYECESESARAATALINICERADLKLDLGSYSVTTTFNVINDKAYRSGLVLLGAPFLQGLAVRLDFHRNMLYIDGTHEVEMFTDNESLIGKINKMRKNGMET